MVACQLNANLIFVLPDLDKPYAMVVVVEATQKCTRSRLCIRNTTLPPFNILLAQCSIAA